MRTVTNRTKEYSNLELIPMLKKAGLHVYANLNDLFQVCRLVEAEFPDIAHETAEEVYSCAIERTIAYATVDLKGSQKFYALAKNAALFLAPTSFDHYLIYVEWNREPQKKFYIPRRKVLKPIVDDLQDLHDGEIDFLSISLPPRVGKSTLGCFFITWLMGKYPGDANVMSGHSDKLTDGFYREVLSILSDSDYLWSDVFPDHTVGNTNAKNESIDIDKARRFPTLTCRSIGGTLTGAVEVAKCLYCDDLIEDLEEALNPLRLQTKYDAYANQLKDRMKEKAFQLMIGTRWSVQDIQGRIEDQYAGNPRYRFRVIPAIDEDGESNFEYPYDLGFSKEYYADMKESIDDATWCAKYLGKPYVREGLLFPEDELLRYNGVLPDGEPNRIVSVDDVAWGGGDSLSHPFAYVYDDSVYIHDVVFNRGDKTVTRPVVVGKMKLHKPHMTRFEGNNGGDEYADNVDKDLKKDGVRLNITSAKAPSTQSKLSRIIQMSPEIKKFYFIDSKNASKEYNAFMKELTTFVVTGKNPHDDAADSLAMLADFLYHGVAKVTVIKRPY